MIKVMIIEGQQLMREGLKALLSSSEDIEIIGLAANTDEAQRLFKANKPDVILMDVNIKDIDGVTVTYYMKDRHPEIKIVLLSTETSEKQIFDGIASGADSYLMKDFDINHLTRSIREIVQGGTVISGEVAKIVAKRIKEFHYDEEHLLEYKLRAVDVKLSKRESQIAFMLMKNYSNQNIADRLNLSEGTVKNYISTVYSKVDLHRRQDVRAFLMKLLNESMYK